MSELAVLVPSRGRPENIARLMDAWDITRATARLCIFVDEDDTTIDGYIDLFGGLVDDRMTLTIGDRKRLGGTLNAYAPALADMYFATAFMGDDHLPLTEGWDRIILAELHCLGTGIVYGNDLIQGENLPTAVFMTSDIVRTLGYMVPPTLTHMFLDNAWKEWGQSINRLSYLPYVWIEHIHPLVEKAAQDAGYDEANAYMHPDSIAYEKYKTDGSFDADVAKLKALIGPQ